MDRGLLDLLRKRFTKSMLLGTATSKGSKGFLNMRSLNEFVIFGDHASRFLLLLFFSFGSGCSSRQTQYPKRLNMTQSKAPIFVTESVLVPSVNFGRPSSLFLRVQNISSNEIWVLHDVTTILVPSEIDDDGINDVHFDFGSDPEAQYERLYPDSWFEYQVLVDGVLEEKILKVMKVRAPVMMRHHLDSDDQVVLLMFNVSRDAVPAPTNQD